MSQGQDDGMETTADTAQSDQDAQSDQAAQSDQDAHRSQKKIRYAVVGLGWFAQVAILPAFANAGDNSELAALVSGDEEKLRVLGERFGVERRVGYDAYEELLASGDVDAVYLAVPNHLHAEFAVTAARAGVHVLCEKPMAVDAAECEQMIRAAQAGGVKLMVAYRLHFEEANMKAVEILESGGIGEPRLVSAVFANPVSNPDDIRLNPLAQGGGTLYDIGIYCLNAARYLFRAEPSEVMAMSASSDDPRFADSDEMTAVVLRFPGARMATFVSSFGAHDSDSFRVLGTDGELLVEPAFQFNGALGHRLTRGDEVEETTFETRDQVAPEIVYFSDCILNDREPEPGGHEGLADVRIIQALYRSAAEGKAIRLPETAVADYPGLHQEIHRFPAPGEQELVATEGP